MSADPSNDNHVLGGGGNAHEVDPHCPLASQHSPNVDPTQVVSVPSTIPQRPSVEMARGKTFGSQSLELGFSLSQDSQECM